MSTFSMPRSTRGRKVVVGERGLVGGERALVLGGAVDVVEHAAGQATLGDAAQVVDRRRAGQAPLDAIGLDRPEPDHRAQGLVRVHTFSPGSLLACLIQDRSWVLVELVVLVDVEVAHLVVLGRLRRNRIERGPSEELQLHVLRVAAERQEPAVVLDAVERLVPLDRLVHVGDRAHDEGIEALPHVALPVGHGRDVVLHRAVALPLGDLRVAAREQLRAGLLLAAVGHGTSLVGGSQVSCWTRVAQGRQEGLRRPSRGLDRGGMTATGPHPVSIDDAVAGLRFSAGPEPLHHRGAVRRRLRDAGRLPRGRRLHRPVGRNERVGAPHGRRRDRDGPGGRDHDLLPHRGRRATGGSRRPPAGRRAAGHLAPLRDARQRARDERDAAADRPQHRPPT